MVPTEFAAFDPRGIVKHSTKIRIADDRNGRRASRVADQFNRELEANGRPSLRHLCRAGRPLRAVPAARDCLFRKNFDSGRKRDRTPSAFLPCDETRPE